MQQWLLMIVALVALPLGAMAQEVTAGQPVAASNDETINLTVDGLITTVETQMNDANLLVDALEDDVDDLSALVDGLRARMDAIKACTEGVAGFDVDGNVICAVAPFCDSGTLMLNGNTSECRTAEEPIKNVTPGGCRGGFVRQSGVDTAGNTFSRCVFDASGIGR